MFAGPIAQSLLISPQCLSFVSWAWKHSHRSLIPYHTWCLRVHEILRDKFSRVFDFRCAQTPPSIPRPISVLVWSERSDCWMCFRHFYQMTESVLTQISHVYMSETTTDIRIQIKIFPWQPRCGTLCCGACAARMADFAAVPPSDIPCERTVYEWTRG